MVGQLEALGKHGLQHFGNLIGAGARGKRGPDLEVLAAGKVGRDNALRNALEMMESGGYPLISTCAPSTLKAYWLAASRGFGVGAAMGFNRDHLEGGHLFNLREDYAGADQSTEQEKTHVALIIREFYRAP